MQKAPGHAQYQVKDFIRVCVLVKQIQTCHQVRQRTEASLPDFYSCHIDWDRLSESPICGGAMSTVMGMVRSLVALQFYDAI